MKFVDYKNVYLVLFDVILFWYDFELKAQV